MDDLRHWSDKLQTQRLDLYALTPSALYTYLNATEALEAELGWRLSRAILTPIVRRAIEMKLDKMAMASAQDWPWYTYWLAEIREIQFGAGLIGFKGSPDELGRVEIGYGIDPEAGGRGYTTEAARALIEWAFMHPRCREIMAPDTRKDNPASHRVLSKLGMQAYAETDEAISYHLTRTPINCD